jgi:hypothetical protein
VAKVPPRLLGLILLAASWASTIVHRGVYEAARQGPAQAIEFGLSLATFVLATTGVLLMIHGAKLFARADGGACVPARSETLYLRALLEAPITPAGRAFDTRHGASMMQARHAIATSRQAGTRLALPTEQPDRAGRGRAVQPRT